MEWKKENPEDDELAEKVEAAAEEALNEGPIKMTAMDVVVLLAMERIDRSVKHLKWLAVAQVIVSAAVLVILSRVL